MRSLKKLVVIFVSLIFIAVMFTACGGDEGSVNEDVDAITADAVALDVGDFTFASGDDANDVTEDFTLPTSGDNGGAISWNSNNTGLVSISGGSATVDNTVYIESYGFSKSVVLTATITKGTESTTKEITIYILPPDTQKVAVIVDSVTFKMVLAPGGKTFPTGVSDDGTASVSEPYWIAETEVTYELWSKVYIWATGDTDMNGAIDGGETAGSYQFANTGVKGDGTGDTIQHPVSTINWRDAMVWCNALTEWYNAQKGTGYNCMYYTDSGYITPIRTTTSSTIVTWEPGVGSNDGTQDDPYIKSDADGFRLLRSNEWKLAARYRGTDTVNTVQSIIDGVNFSNPADGIFWTKGNSASGATKAYNDASSDNGTYAVFSVASMAEVKSKTANALGLYDISGNIWEMCFDWDSGYEGTARFRPSGSAMHTSEWLQVGKPYRVTPYSTDAGYGFRFSKNR